MKEKLIEFLQRHRKSHKQYEELATMFKDESGLKVSIPQIRHILEMEGLPITKEEMEAELSGRFGTMPPEEHIFVGENQPGDTHSRIG